MKLKLAKVPRRICEEKGGGGKRKEEGGRRRKQEEGGQPEGWLRLLQPSPHLEHFELMQWPMACRVLACLKVQLLAPPDCYELCKS